MTMKNKRDADDFHVLLGKRIRSLRERYKISQERLSEEAGLSSKYLGEVERGLGNISIDKLNKIARALGVSLTSIVECEQEKPKNDLIKEVCELLPKLKEHDVQIIYKLVKSFTE